MIHRIAILAVAAIASSSAQCYPPPTACGCFPPPPPCGCLPPRPVYRVALDNYGPNPCPAPPVQAPPVQAPAITKPPVALPACIPPTQVISATANCIKTVLKPQLYHQQVSVPIISQFLQTASKPVTEVITFDAIPCGAPACYGTAPPTGLFAPGALAFPPALPTAYGLPPIGLGCGVPPPVCFGAPPSVTIPGCPGLYIPGSSPFCLS